MKVVVPIKIVPDIVEELIVDAYAVALDTMEISFCLNELDDHAIEQAILFKENDGSHVTIVALDTDEADNVFYNAAARGADQLIKLAGDFDEFMSNHAYACILAPLMRELEPDLILTGVQAHNDLDGQLGPLLAEHLKFPYIGYVAGIKRVNGQAAVHKEYPGGLIANLSVDLPAVIGIQAAEQPPRYVAYSRVRQAMNTATIEVRMAVDTGPGMTAEIRRLFHPESDKRATMIDGEVDEVAAQLLSILTERGYLKRGHS